MCPEPLIGIFADQLLERIGIELGDLPDVMLLVSGRGVTDRRGSRKLEVIVVVLAHGKDRQNRMPGLQMEQCDGHMRPCRMPEECDFNSLAAAGVLVGDDGDGITPVQRGEQRADSFFFGYGRMFFAHAVRVEIFSQLLICQRAHDRTKILTGHQSVDIAGEFPVAEVR